MRSTALLALSLFACTDNAAPADASAVDAGSTCDAGVGPLGTCLVPKSPCDECSTAGDCTNGADCVDFAGCRLCAATRGTTQCAVSSCVSGNECCDGFCHLRDDPPPCGGAPMPAPDECDDARPCPDNARCVPIDVRCSASGPGRVCRPVCPATPCESGEACHDGTCAPARCDTDGFDCGTLSPLRVCDPSRGDAHGCARKSCSTHTDCPGGLCANGTCTTGLGSCLLPMP